MAKLAKETVGKTIFFEKWRSWHDPWRGYGCSHGGRFGVYLTDRTAFDAEVEPFSARDEEVTVVVGSRL